MHPTPTSFPAGVREETLPREKSWGPQGSFCLVEALGFNGSSFTTTWWHSLSIIEERSWIFYNAQYYLVPTVLSFQRTVEVIIQKKRKKGGKKDKRQKEKTDWDKSSIFTYFPNSGDCTTALMLFCAGGIPHVPATCFNIQCIFAGFPVRDRQRTYLFFFFPLLDCSGSSSGLSLWHDIESHTHSSRYHLSHL